MAMVKIDTNTIEGYSDMTPEQKVAALEAIEYEDNSEELDRSKKALSKANSEAAEYKRQLKQQQSQTTQSSEEVTSLKTKIEEMEKRERVADNKAQFLALGYDEVLATETAQALVDGDTAKVFANQKKFLENHDKDYKSKLMGNTPTPPPGDNGNNGSSDYAKLAEEAQANGNAAMAAYYLRLKGMEENNKTN